MAEKNKRRVGFAKEEEAARYLRGNGYLILTKNFYCRFGEIDIVAKKGPACVFVEVKYRREDGYGRPEAAVDYRKRRKIIKTADYYRITHPMPAGTQFRFDVISVTGSKLKHYENAFGYDGNIN